MESKSASSTNMSNAEFSIGDTVWSKMKGYSPWPSRIAEPSESALKPPSNQKGSKPSHLVYFFGSHDFAWISEEHIKPYQEFKDKNKNGCKKARFKDGLKEIEEFIKSGGKTTLNSASAIPDTKVSSSLASGAGDAVNDSSNNCDGKLSFLPTFILTFETTFIKNNKSSYLKHFCRSAKH